MYCILGPKLFLSLGKAVKYVYHIEPLERNTLSRYLRSITGPKGLYQWSFKSYLHWREDRDKSCSNRETYETGTRTICRQFTHSEYVSIWIQNDPSTDDCPTQGTLTELQVPPVITAKLTVHSVLTCFCDKVDSPESEMVAKSCLT